jgi:hypothetical protein
MELRDFIRHAVHRVEWLKILEVLHFKMYYYNVFKTFPRIYNVSSIKSKLYYISFMRTFYITNEGKFYKHLKPRVFLVAV